MDNKKQIFIIAGAVVAGVVAVILMSHYVKDTIENQTQALSEQYDAKQKEMVSEITQRNDQQMAALEQELERVKTEEAENMKKQMLALQAAQQARQAEVKPVIRHPSLALKTPVGKRAVTVKIDSLAAVGGLLNAGDFVDVIAQLKVPGQESDNNTVTAMIFQGLQVLAVNTNENDPGAYDEQQAAQSLKVTFAVDPQEAGLLAFANNNGTLQLALRSPDDSDHLKFKADTWKTLADYIMRNQGPNIENPDETPENKTEENVKPTIQIFRGGKEL